MILNLKFFRNIFANIIIYKCHVQQPRIYRIICNILSLSTHNFFCVAPMNGRFKAFIVALQTKIFHFKKKKLSTQQMTCMHEWWNEGKKWCFISKYRYMYEKCWFNRETSSHLLHTHTNRETQTSNVYPFPSDLCHVSCKRRYAM